MRTIAHLISVALLVPGLVVAAVMLALGHVTGQPDLLRFAGALLEVLLAFLPATFLVFVSWIALALTGFSRRLRRAGALAVAGVALGTGALMLRLGGPWAALSDAGVFVPGAFALAIAVSLACTDWPDEEQPAGASASPP
jgi:hypothetical protein